MGGTDGSPGSTTGRHHRDEEERSWLEMLAADDDVEGPSLLRAPDVLTRNGASPDAPVLDDDGLLLRPLGSLGDDDGDFACGGDVCDLVHRAPVHGGIARGVISALRRSATDVGGELGRRRADVRAAASPRGVAPRGEARRRPPDRGGGGHTRGRHSPLAGGPGDASLVERLRDSLCPDRAEDLSERRGARGGLRRARTLPTNLHAHDDDLPLDPRAAQADVVAARAVEAAAQAASPRPFGYLGVTRPPWTTRWEANLVDEHTGGHVFLGNFDQKESAARAHDAAKLKLALGDDEPVPQDQLNFDASDYREELSAMTECTFEDFVKTLVTHSYGGSRSAGHSKFRGVFAREDGLWEAKLDAEDAGGAREDRRWKK